ncbi:sensor histidine kinase [Paenibacillus sp. GCM10027626]|uniref:cache domain-containing sensor histidine kinase n=1 Tax=Paenibacillus sp. GCM10027626 TaxID=3273411 RepID=UPI003643C6A8
MDIQLAGRTRGLYRLRTKLAISFFCVIFVTLSGVGLTYYERMSTELQTNTYTGLERLVSQTASQIEMQMEQIQREAWGFFSDTDFQIVTDNLGLSEFFPKAIYYRNKMHAALRNNQQLALISVHNLSGNSMISGLKSNLLEGERLIWEQETEETIRLATAMQGNGAWRVARSLSDKDEQSMSTLSYVQAIKKINTYEQTQVGTLRIDLQADWLLGQLQSVQLKDSGDAMLVDQQGTIIFAQDEQQIGRSIADTALFSNYLSARKLGGRHYDTQIAGESYLAVYAPFKSKDWILFGSVPLTEVLEGANKAKREAFTIGIIILLIAMTVALLISSGVTRPLQRLRNSMKQVEMGNFDVEVPLLSYDEIGALGNSFNRMTREIRGLISKVYESELLKKDAEIMALQSQINPHFLYNALSTIDSIAAVYKDPRVSTVSQGLASMFRYSISGGQAATITEEVVQLHMYLSIQKVRYGERLQYKIELDPELKVVAIPRLLLQPIVENAFVHGIERKRGERSVQVQIRKAAIGSHRIEILVSDNGHGMTGEEVEALRGTLAEQSMGAVYLNRQEHGQERASIGLSNVARRIRLFYGEDCGITISSQSGEGTTVCLLIKDQMEGAGDI